MKMPSQFLREDKQQNTTIVQPLICELASVFT